MKENCHRAEPKRETLDHKTDAQIDRDESSTGQIKLERILGDLTTMFMALYSPPCFGGFFWRAAPLNENSIGGHGVIQCQSSAIRINRLPGDIRRVVAGEKRGDCGDFLGFAATSQWRARQDLPSAHWSWTRQSTTTCKSSSAT